MAVATRRRGGIPVLIASGEFYGGNETDALRDALREQLEAGNLRLVLNLSDCGMMNSTALSVMIEARRRFEARGGEIRLCGVERRMKSLLVATRLYDWFGHHDTEAEAVAALSASGSRA
jgi:anti-anti-sigma factor